jgi:hypothetical protein
MVLSKISLHTVKSFKGELKELTQDGRVDANQPSLGRTKLARNDNFCVGSLSRWMQLVRRITVLALLPMSLFLAARSVQAQTLTPLPVVAQDGGDACGSISSTSSVHGRTKFISFKNIRLRVRLVINSYPLVAKLVCFTIHQRLSISSGSMVFAEFA